MPQLEFHTDEKISSYGSGIELNREVLLEMAI
jgi:hypothetical protein